MMLPPFYHFLKMPRHCKEMGAGQSVSEATRKFVGKSGPFELDALQNRVFKQFSALLNELLQTANIFDLASLLNTQEGCSKLYIVLSSLLRKEFQLMRFPDPDAPSTTLVASVMPKEAYADMEKSLARKAICLQIIHFAVRYVTLVAALTASLYRSPTLTSLLQPSDAQGSAQSAKLRGDVKDLSPTFKFEGRPAISQMVLDELRKPGTGFTKVDEVRDLYIFRNQPSVVIDAKRSIVYAAMGTTDTGVLGIKITPQMIIGAAPTIAYTNPYMPYAAPAAAAPGFGAPTAAAPVAATAAPGFGVPIGMAAPGRMSSNASSTFSSGVSFTGASTQLSGGRSRRQRRGGKRKTRRHRRQRGGQTNLAAAPSAAIASPQQQQTAASTIQYFTVELYQLVGATDGALVKSILVGSDGQVYTKEYIDAKMRGQAIFGTLPTFADTLKPMLESNVVTKIPLVAPRIATELPELTAYPKTKEEFDALYTAMKNVKEGASPAIYRAFLLASSVEDGPILNTLFCTDGWMGQRMTSTLGYALLNALFYDKMPMKATDAPDMSAAARSELATLLGAFSSGEKVAVLSTGVVATESLKTFREMKFADYPSELKIFCQKEAAADVRKIRNADDIRILTGGYEAIRTLYAEHSAKCGAYLFKIMKVYTDPVTQTRRLLLANVFESHPRGALAALEELIAEARQMLSAHYLAVEKTYRQTLLQLKDRMLGESTAPAASETA